MNLSFMNNLHDPALADFEVVERKGRGHPDTLADRLAELLSRTYSELCRQKFGTILRHQFDKLSLMGGKCDVTFGGGGFRAPLRLLINGRATPEVGTEKLFYRDALIDAAGTFLEAELKNFDFLTNCRLMLEIGVNTTRGVLESPTPNRSSSYSRFRPAQLADLPEYTRPVSNDTAVGCGWAPYSPLEALVLQIESTLNSKETKAAFPWLGSDIKIMAFRIRNATHLTICVPQISTLVPTLAEYTTNREIILSIITDIATTFEPFFSVDVSLTTGDKSRPDLIYLLYTGSCIESGDEGQVARGNRIGGLISSRRPFSIEGVSGKNPQYHGGKLYSVMAWELAQNIWTKFNVRSEVYFASQTDRPLSDPWQIIVNTESSIDKNQILALIDEMLSDIGSFTSKILAGGYPLV